MNASEFLRRQPSTSRKPARVGNYGRYPWLHICRPKSIDPLCSAPNDCRLESQILKVTAPLKSLCRVGGCLLGSLPHHYYINIRCSVSSPDRARGCLSSGSERRSCDMANALGSWGFLISRLLDGASPSETSAVVFVIDQPC